MLLHWLPKTFWLSLTNVLLAVAVVLCFLVIAVGLLCDYAMGLKKRRSYRSELDHDLRELFGLPDPRMASPGTRHPRVEVTGAPDTGQGILVHFCACMRLAWAALKRWCSFHRGG